MAEVILKNVCKIYNENIYAAKNINLEIKDKEFIILVGPSGCGKSTTLRMIAGLEEISKGEIYIDGKLVNNVPPKDRDIAMVFQNYALYPHMTVFENIAFGLKLRKYPKEEIKKRVEEAAKILSLENYLDRKPKELSGGQRQRVAVGRAIVREPKVFLFDEPLSNLDAKKRVQMRAEIIKLHQKLNATMIYVTHDQTEAMTMGDRIVVMKDGEIQQVDTPINLYNNPNNKFVAGFIGSPEMNFISGIIKKDNDNIFFQDDKEKVKINLDNYKININKYINKKVYLGIRPEDIDISTQSNNSVNGIVDLIEPMGNEVFIHIILENNEKILIRKEPENIPHLGEKISFNFNLNKIHLFDFETESVLK